MKMNSLTLFLVILLVTSGSCNHNDSPARKIPAVPAREEKITKLTAPVSGTAFTIGEEITLEYSFSDTVKIDSALVYFRGVEVGKMGEERRLNISTLGALPGKAGVRIKIFFDQGMSETHSTQVTLKSDIVPLQYRYRIVNTYPHDAGAYTQGLQYYEGWLYEGTGNKNQSTIRKVRLEDGDVIQMRNNASEIFGEGITIFKGRIYQLTYHAQVCFIYDLNTFDEIQKVYYQNKEGWGLTNNGSDLIMSDGTNVIYFIDPDMFTVKHQVEVFDNKGAVDALNELEYINGKIYANRYYTDEIIIIDPLTGKVEGRVDLKGILPVKERKPSTNVLNGIAWDNETGRLFVTGKYWPKLYEIRIQPIITD